LRLIHSGIRLKDLLGPVTRVKKKKKKVEGLPLLARIPASGSPMFADSGTTTVTCAEQRPK